MQLYRETYSLISYITGKTKFFKQTRKQKKEQRKPQTLHTLRINPMFSETTTKFPKYNMVLIRLLLLSR